MVRYQQTEVQGAETPVAAATAPANQADSNKEKEAVKPETEKVAEVKPEVKAEEAKKVNDIAFNFVENGKLQIAKHQLPSVSLVNI